MNDGSDHHERPSPAALLRAGVRWQPGDRVRLRPQGRADIFDLALTGMPATVVAIEQDFEERIYIAVTVDDDPGKDFGAQGKPGHRFYFRPDEVEPIDREASPR